MLIIYGITFIYIISSLYLIINAYQNFKKGYFNIDDATFRCVTGIFPLFNTIIAIYEIIHSIFERIDRDEIVRTNIKL